MMSQSLMFLKMIFGRQVAFCLKCLRRNILFMIRRINHPWITESAPPSFPSSAEIFISSTNSSNWCGKEITRKELIPSNAEPSADCWFGDIQHSPLVFWTVSTMQQAYKALKIGSNSSLFRHAKTGWMNKGKHFAQIIAKLPNYPQICFWNCTFWWTHLQNNSLQQSNSSLLISANLPSWPSFVIKKKSCFQSIYTKIHF